MALIGKGSFFCLTLTILVFLGNTTGVLFDTLDTPLGNEKVLYFKFDEGSGSKIDDQTNYNNDGTIYSATWVNGLFGNGLAFDGTNDYLDVPDSDSLDLGSGLTIESWVYPKGFQGDGSKGGNVILSKWNSAPTGQYVINAYTGGNLQFRISDGTTTEKIESTGSLFTDRWQYIVGTWDGTTMYLYVDGKEISKKTTSITTLYSSDYTDDQLRIGHVSTSTLNNWHFNGIIDELSIYNYSLSAQTIKDNFYSTLPRTIPNSTISHWDLNDGAGSNANDLTSNGNDGALSEAQWTRGIEGSGLIFDGVNDNVFVADSKSLDVRFGLSLEAWILARSFSGDGNTGGNAIISKWETSTKGQYHLSAYGNGGLAFRISEGTKWDILKADGVLTPKSWHHIVATWNYDRMDLYVDGKLIVGKTTVVNELYQTEYDSGDYLNLGVDTNSLSQSWYFQGILDEIIVRNYALNQSEVNGEYHRFIPWTLDDLKIGHWGFDSAAGNIAVDDIGKNNGSVVDAQWERGLVGNALRFDGIYDIVEIPDSSELTFLWGLTIEAWINADSFYGNGVQSGNPILTKWVSSPVGEYFLSTFEGGNVVFAVSNGFIRDRMVVPAAMEPGKWHHVVATWDGKIMSVYVDGALKGWELTNTPYFYQEEYSGDDIKIGYLTSSWRFDGVIDEVSLYNYPLSPSEISDTYERLAPLTLPKNISLNIYEDNNGINDAQLNNDGLTYLGDTVTFGIETEPFIESSGLSEVTDRFSAFVRILDPKGEIHIPLTMNDEKDEWVAEYTPTSAGSWEVTARVSEIRYDFNYAEPANPRPLVVFLPVRLAKGFDTNITFYEDDSYTLDLTNAFEGGAPSEGDFEFDNVGNTIKWPLGWNVSVSSEHVYEITPPKNFSGVLTYVTVRVNDLYIMSTDFIFDIFVIPLNDPPIILGSPISECEEDLLYWCNFTLIDPDLYDFHIWDLNSEASFLSLDRGNLSGIPSNNDVGDHEVSISCSDGQNRIAYLNYTLTVLNVNDDPTITNQMAEEMMEDLDFQFEFEAIDIDPTEDPLTWSMETDCSFLSLDRSTGFLWGRPKNEDVGAHWIMVYVSDEKGGSDQKGFSFNVTNVNDIPSVLDFPKEIFIIEDSVDHPIHVDEWFFDIDGDELVYTSSFSEVIEINLIGTGVLGLTPDRNWNGREKITILTSDLKEEIFIEIYITVTPVNDAPENASINIIKQRFLKGEMIVLNGSANDADLEYGDILTMNWFLDRGLIGIQGETFEVIPAIGKHLVILNVTDSTGLWTTTSIEVEVYEKSHPSNFLLIGIVVFLIVLFLVIFLIFMIYFVKRRRKEKEERSKEGPTAIGPSDSNMLAGTFANSMLGGVSAPMQLPSVMRTNEVMEDLPESTTIISGALPPASIRADEALYARPGDKGMERMEIIPQPTQEDNKDKSEDGGIITGKLNEQKPMDVFQAGPSIAPMMNMVSGWSGPVPPEVEDKMVPTEEVFHEGDRQVWSPDMVESRVSTEAKTAVELLHKLNELKQEGAITEEEYEVSKNRLLRKI